MSKLKTAPAIKQREVLYAVLTLLHPVIPFVTDTIAREIQMPLQDGTLMVQPWPQADTACIDTGLEKRMAELQQLITDIRNLRTEYRIAPGQVLEVIDVDMPADEKALVQHLARIQFVAEKSYTTAAHIVSGDRTLLMPLDGVVDVTQEKRRITTQIAEIEKHLASISAKLNNEKFMANARQDIVDQTRALYAQREAELEQLKKSLAVLS
jgi:valyl-tRNA synthetase